jgi:hypothetical protein
VLTNLKSKTVFNDCVRRDTERVCVCAAYQLNGYFFIGLYISPCGKKKIQIHMFSMLYNNLKKKNPKKKKLYPSSFLHDKPS